MHRVLTRRTGRSGRQKDRIPHKGVATPPARLRAARTAPMPETYPEIDRKEIPRDRSFWNIFLDQVQATHQERKVTDRNGHQSRPALERALHHFHAAPAPHSSLCRKSTSATKTGGGRSRTALAPGPGKSAPRVSATDSRRAAPARARDARPEGRDPQPMATATRSAASMASSAGLLARQGSPVAKRCALIARKTANDKSALQAENVVVSIRPNSISVAKPASKRSRPGRGERQRARGPARPARPREPRP